MLLTAVRDKSVPKGAARYGSANGTVGCVAALKGIPNE